MALPPRDQRHQYLRYEGLQYRDTDILDFESRLTRIYMREVHRVHVFDFGGLPDLMADRLSGRMLMGHRDAQGVSLFTSRAWKRLFDIRGPLVHELILEFFSTLSLGITYKGGDRVPASSLIKRVYMLSLRERMKLDLEARIMGETLVLNRSFDPFLEHYIELNDLNEPFELRRNQRDDLMPTIEEGEVNEEFRTRDDELNVRIDDYPSYCNYDKKIYIDCAQNLKFSCMIGFEFTHANFFPLLYVNVMSKKFHNSIMKEKMVYKGNNVVGALMNVPIFVGTFSIVTDFFVLENIDDYRDEGMGDVIFGEPFLREVGIKTRRFEGMITIYNEWMMRVSEEDKMNGISHSYQKLKGFYKGVLNLGPDYIRDAKMEEWLTHGHISVHGME
ncbi:hypothetical protein Tco_0439183 [Tanacetum coccineum]